MLLRWLLALGLIPLSACYVDAQDEFTRDRTLDRCESTIPVCTTSAACVLDETNYLEGSFAEGATRRFIVRTTTAAVISVELMFTKELSPGIDTEVTWYETGCQDRVTASSGGTDVFREAGDDGVWKRQEKVVTAGDHLVEVFSDAQADYLLRVRILPGQ